MGFGSKGLWLTSVLASIMDVYSWDHVGSILIDVDFKWRDLTLLFNDKSLNLHLIIHMWILRFWVWELYHDGFEMTI